MGWLVETGGSVSRYGSDQTSQLTTASLQAGMYISSNATLSQVKCHDLKLASSYRASKCSKTSTTMTLSAPHRAVQPLGPSSPLLLRRIWNFTALTLHRHSFRQIACQRASMADSSSRPLQALHTPIPLVLYTRCFDPSMVSPPARAPCTKHLIDTSKVKGLRTQGSKNDGVWREFYLCLLWRRIHTTETSVRDIYSVAVPEINLSKLEHAVLRLTTCVSESRPSRLMKMMISACIRL